MSKGAGSLRYSSIAVMPQRLRELVEAQGCGAAQQGGSKPDAKPNKYKNHPTVVDNFRFPSKKEARYYETLKMRVAAGEVSHFLMQVTFRLPGGTRYVLDFLVFFVDPSRAPEYIDVKGRLTAEFKIKKREVEHHYPIKIRCV